MKILVLFSNEEDILRKTIKDHLYCFEKYIKDVEFHYCNVLTKIPFYLSLVKYDGIILHYTLLSMRWTPNFWRFFSKGLSLLRYMNGVKVAIPQDEFVETESLCTLFRKLKIDSVFTCANPVDYQTLYPSEKTLLKHYVTTFTGFVDEETLALIHELSKQIPRRDIDIGYRVRSLPFWLGEFGQYKAKIAAVFNACKDKTSLKIDVSTDPKDVFYGNDWIRFMLRCRVMPGCLGGASLYDSDGTIRKNVEEFTQKNPEATFEEVAQKCFPEKDYSLSLFALSPRHFECAMTKTCQVLLEGDYQGVFEAGRHYIELKKDFSNLDDVLKQIENKELCEKIAEEAFNEVVLSGKYTYRHFAREVVEHIREKREKGYQTKTKLNNLLFKVAGYFLENRKNWKSLHKFLFRVCRFFVYGIPKRIGHRLNQYRKVAS